MDQPTHRDETAYLCALEEYFVAVRGRGVQWALSDAEVARAWQRQGVALGVVLRVVQARVRAWRFRHGDTARLPMALRWYAPAVAQAARALGPVADAAASPLAPAHDASAAAPLFAELLDPLPALLAETSHLALRHAYAQAFEALDRAQRPGGEAAARGEDGPADEAEAEPADPAAAISRVRRQVRNHVVAGLRDDEAAALQAWLAPQRPQLAQRLSKKAAAERLAALQERWLGEHLGLRVPTPRGWLDPRDAP